MICPVHKTSSPGLGRVLSAVEFVSGWLLLHKQGESELGTLVRDYLQAQHAAVVKRLDRFSDLRPQYAENLVPAVEGEAFHKLVWPKVSSLIDAGMARSIERYARTTKRRGEIKKAVPRTGIYHNSEGILINVLGVQLEALKAELSFSFGQQYWESVTETTRNGLRGIILDGLTTGKTSGDIARKIATDESGLFSLARAKTIARTETTSALNAGHWAFAEELLGDPETGVIGREWVTVGDNDVRKSHEWANGQRVKQGQLFTLAGGQARFPGDPWLPGSERINCRCTIVEVFSWDKDMPTVIPSDSMLEEMMFSVPELVL